MTALFTVGKDSTQQGTILEQHTDSSRARVAALAQDPYVTIIAHGNLSWDLGTCYRRNRNDSQWYNNLGLSTDDASFNVKELHASAVMRGEYLPGSTVFVVWTQGREQADPDLGSFAPSRDFKGVFSARPDNRVLIKASYWINF